MIPSLGAPKADVENSQPRQANRLPRLGFLGVGWIGRHRLESIARSRQAEIKALADFNPALAAAAAQECRAVTVESLEDLFRANLDGLVIATPTALHAEQAMAALKAGLAVFCQKPLGRTAEETQQVIQSARRENRLLGIDMSYRFVRGVKKIKELVSAGAIGKIYAIDLVFHNAYGPDKPWYYDPALSGGGCVIDLGIHLVDMALWMLDFAAVERVSSRLFAHGKSLRRGDHALEDYAVARLDFHGGATANLSCSWHLPAGQDAVIRICVYGTEGGFAMHNVEGSFYDFHTEQLVGTSRKILDEPPDDWGGRAALAWIERLADSRAYDPEIQRAEKVAEIIDVIYGRKPFPDEEASQRWFIGNRHVRF
jgi:predicted dehydrogenase